MPLFLCLITPSFVLGMAAWRTFAPLKQPSARFGYRSTLSMMNPATWAEAQRVSGKAMAAAGLTGLAFSLLFYFLVQGKAAYMWSMIISSALAALTVPYTEMRLGAIFDEKGKRKPEGVQCK